MKYVYFAVEAGDKIGLGHFYRSLRLAVSLRKLGVDVAFDELNLTESLKGKLNDLEFEVVDSGRANKASPDLAVYDGYGFDNGDFDSFSQTKVAVFEDYKHRQITADIVIDANLTTRNDPNEPENCNCSQMIQGKEFIVLDYVHSEKKKLTEEGNSQKRLLISLGGSDPRGLTWTVLEEIVQIQGSFSSITAVIGPLFKDAEQKREKFSNLFDNLDFVYSPSTLEGLNRKHDLAVGAGGTSAYERVASGLASVNLITENNQLRLANNLAQHGLALSLDARRKNLSNLNNQLLSIDSDFIDSVKHVGPKTVDGRGAERLAKKLFEIVC